MGGQDIERNVPSSQTIIKDLGFLFVGLFEQIVTTKYKRFSVFGGKLIRVDQIFDRLKIIWILNKVVGGQKLVFCISLKSCQFINAY